MGARGPAPKPADILKLEGGYRKDRHADRAGMPDADGKPERPADLAGEPAAFWDAVAGDLARNGTAKRLDTSLLRAASELWGLYRAALAKAQADPVDKNARCAVTSYFAAWERAAAKLGLTPADRARLRIGGPADSKPAGVMSRKRG